MFFFVNSFLGNLTFEVLTWQHLFLNTIYLILIDFNGELKCFG